MKFVKKIKADKHHQNDERKQLINEMMQFLLQRQASRFSKQLKAQLLDEGCNYPIVLAKSRFYELMVLGLAEKLNPVPKKKFDKRISPDLSNLNHIQFSETMNYFVSHLKNFEKQMAIAVINSLEQIIDEWKLDTTFFSGGPDEFNAHLQTIVRKFATASASSWLPSISINRIRRRLYIALTTSLYRFTRDQQTFQLEFGSIPGVLKAMQTDHTVFGRVMAFFSTQTPYFSHAASSTFWRTLQALNTDCLPQGLPAKNNDEPICE
jgi:hypothetical protein